MFGSRFADNRPVFNAPHVEAAVPTVQCAAVEDLFPSGVIVEGDGIGLRELRAQQYRRQQQDSNCNEHFSFLCTMVAQASACESTHSQAKVCATGIFSHWRDFAERSTASVT